MAFSESLQRTYRNLAKNFAPVAVVSVAIRHPTTVTNIKKIMCKLRSFVLPEVQVARSDIRNVAIHTGAVIKGVSILPYPSVSLWWGRNIGRSGTGGRCGEERQIGRDAYLPRPSPTLAKYQLNLGRQLLWHRSSGAIGRRTFLHR